MRYGGRDLTLVRKGEVPSSGIKAGVEVWIGYVESFNGKLDEAGIASAGSNDFTVSWDEGVDNPPMYAHAFFASTQQTPLAVYEPSTRRASPRPGATTSR